MKVLLSIKPEFANAILAGDKRFEFRRAVFRAEGVRRVVIYASSPIQRVVGEFLVDDILEMKLDALWATTAKYAGIQHEYFQKYFAGRETGFALGIRQPRRYRRALTLSDHCGLERPPQSFCYLPS